MVDTKRSSSDLVTNLFQDGQSEGSISEQDLRDFIVSMKAPYGAADFEANATETTINTINVFEAIAGTFVASANLHEITVNAAGGVFTYTGAPDRHFHIVSQMSFITAANNKVIKYQWYKNDTTALTVPIEVKVGTGTDIGTASIHADAMLSTNDTLTLKVANSTDATNLTVQDIYTFVMGMFT